MQNMAQDMGNMPRVILLTPLTEALILCGVLPVQVPAPELPADIFEAALREWDLPTFGDGWGTLDDSLPTMSFPKMNFPKMSFPKMKGYKYKWAA